MYRRCLARKATAYTRAPRNPSSSTPHLDKERLNNSLMGFVTPGTDGDTGKKADIYDPHLPQLAWAVQPGSSDHLGEDHSKGATGMYIAWVWSAAAANPR